MNESEYMAVWSRMDTPPVPGTRCLVTDGEVVVIATYLTDNQTKEVVWVFSEINESNHSSFDVYAWMPLPRPLPKLVKVNDEKIVAEN